MRMDPLEVRGQVLLLANGVRAFPIFRLKPVDRNSTASALRWTVGSPVSYGAYEGFGGQRWGR